MMTSDCSMISCDPGRAAPNRRPMIEYKMVSMSRPKTAAAT